MCVVLCPYGRLQSVLADSDTIVVGYDEARGEPRGRKGTPKAGDCVDCGRCFQVCPTGIDIRKGLQLECIGCARCVDACEEVMFKLNRPRGLIRYDSLAGLRHEAKRFWRPRLAGYGVALAAGIIALSIGLSHRRPFEANLLRPQQAPFERVGNEVVNRFVVHAINKRDAPLHLHVELLVPPGSHTVVPGADLELAPFESRQLPVIVETPLPSATANRKVTMRVSNARDDEAVEQSFVLLGI